MFAGASCLCALGGTASGFHTKEPESLLKVAHKEVDTFAKCLCIYVFLLLSFWAYFLSDNFLGEVENFVNNHEAL